MLLGRELLLLHGYPIAKLGQFVCQESSDKTSHERFFSDLSASALSLPLVLAVFVSAWRAAFWSDESDIKEATPQKAFQFEPATEQEDQLVQHLLATMGRTAMGQRGVSSNHDDA